MQLHILCKRLAHLGIIKAVIRKHLPHEQSNASLTVELHEALESQLRPQKRANRWVQKDAPKGHPELAER